MMINNIQMYVELFQMRFLVHFTIIKNLGIHTEMISDGAADLIAKDIIDNKFKGINNNKTITAFSLELKIV